MGVTDMRCVATGLPILGGEAMRCSMIFLGGSAEQPIPLGLPIPGVWSDASFDPDDTWNAKLLLPALAKACSLDVDGPDSVVDQIVFIACEISRPPRGARTVGFCLVLQEFYEAIAEGSEADLHEAHSALAALEGSDIAESTYADADRALFEPVAEQFARFRRWIEANATWADALTTGGHQFDQDEVQDLVRDAGARLRSRPGNGNLLRALEAYTERLPPPESEPSPEEERKDERSMEARNAQFELEHHIRTTLVKRPGITSDQLATSVELCRMLKGIPEHFLAPSATADESRARWHRAIERVGTSDVAALISALRTSK